MLNLIVKKSHVAAVILVGFGAAAIMLWPRAMLELAKQRAIRKFSPADSRVLNCVPSTSAMIVPHLDTNSPLSVVEPSGCEVGLPNLEFQQDAAHKILLTNSDLIVACFGTLDKTNYTSLEHETGRTNTFDFVSSAYRATVTEISAQENMIELRRHLALLLYKATMAPVGFQHSWLQFDRGDLRGFISGDLAKDGKVAIEIYIKQKDEFLTMSIRRRAKSGEMSDVYHILSVLAVTPNPM